MSMLHTYFKEDRVGGGRMIPASSKPSLDLRVPLGEGPSSSSLKATRLSVPDLDGGLEDLRVEDSAGRVLPPCREEWESSCNEQDWLRPEFHFIKLECR